MLSGESWCACRLITGRPTCVQVGARGSKATKDVAGKMMGGPHGDEADKVGDAEDSHEALHEDLAHLHEGRGAKAVRPRVLEDPVGFSVHARMQPQQCTQGPQGQAAARAVLGNPFRGSMAGDASCARMQPQQTAGNHWTA